MIDVPVIPSSSNVPTPPPSPPRRRSRNTPGPGNTPYPRAPSLASSVTPFPVPTQIPLMLPTAIPAMMWQPHPRPHPYIAPQVFFATDQDPIPASLFDASAVARLTGGWPLPGTVPKHWRPPTWPPAGASLPLMTPDGSAVIAPTPSTTLTTLPTPVSIPFMGGSVTGTPGVAAIPVGGLRISPYGALPMLCPYLIPNPSNGSLPWLVWDVRFPPVLAKRITGRRTTLPAAPKLGEPATHPPVPRVHIAYNMSVLGALNAWGPIVVDKGEKGVPEEQR